MNDKRFERLFRNIQNGLSDEQKSKLLEALLEPKNPSKKLIIQVDSSPIYNEGITEGRQQAVQHFLPFRRAELSLIATVASIGSAAGCNHGEQTKKMLLGNQSKLTSSFSQFENAANEIKRSGWYNVETPYEFSEGIIELIQLLRNYSQNSNRDTQAAIRLHIDKVLLGFEGAYKGIVKEKRGRNPDTLKLAIGRLALRYGEPASRKTYEQGKQIYHDLCQIEENKLTDEQKEIKVYLKFYMTENGNIVAFHRRKELGIYIKDARELAKKEQE